MDGFSGVKISNMNSFVKKVLSLFLLGVWINSGACFALEFIDDSIDKGIREKYDTKKIEEDLLPALPADLPYFEEGASDADIFAPSTAPPQKASELPQLQETVQSKPVSTQQNVPVPTTPVVQKSQNTTKYQNTPQPVVKKTPVQTNNYQNSTKTSIKMPKGKKFKVRIASAISDKTPVGTKISFISRYPEVATYVTIPAGTVFRGKVTDSHPPNLAGNGGLIVIEVNEMVYKGKSYNIDAKISVANEKRIFLNNIKGKHQFWKGLVKSTTPGYNYFKKMWRYTCKYWKNNNGVEILLTPITFISGTVVYAVNIVASPVLAIFSKGGPISIPKNADFVIQLRDDIFI